MKFLKTNFIEQNKDSPCEMYKNFRKKFFTFMK